MNRGHRHTPYEALVIKIDSNVYMGRGRGAYDGVAAAAVSLFLRRDDLFSAMRR